MDSNLQKEQFSIAYVRAVAAVAGAKVSRVEIDDDSIDIGLERSGGCAPKLDLQLKCTAEPIPAEGDIAFPLKIKNYNDLRRRPLVSRWLVLMCVPAGYVDWLRIDSQLWQATLKHCAWWTSLANEPDVDNTTSVTVRLPRASIFTPDILKAKFDEIETLFHPL
jgi:hypothetical protein